MNDQKDGKGEEEEMPVDPALKATRYHGVIKERLYVLEQIAVKINDEKKWFVEIRNLEQAFAKELPEHFRNEEELLFPILESRGIPEHKALVARLRTEHAGLLAQMEGITQLLCEHMFPLQPEAAARINEELHRFSQALCQHAETEDEQLFTAVQSLNAGAGR
ncbi:MAG: hemerythrin domain-containing protein [Elusimicrobia bacterium]|nr:hemerythrin domain-containing protein [Elusimicrobiota bacterium]